MFLVLATGLAGLFATSFGAGLPSPSESVRVGKELFAASGPRTTRGRGAATAWVRVYNANSCVACHFAGGVGGAGPNEKNAVIVSASVRLKPKEDIASVPRAGLIAAHPAFRDSIVRGAASRGDGRLVTRPWRADLLAQSHGRFQVVASERNTPALFGAGRIDAIPDAVIVRRARRVDPSFPEIQGASRPRRQGSRGEVRLEGTDGVARPVRANRLRRRAWSGRAGASPVARPQGVRGQGPGARPLGRRVRCAGRLRGVAARALCAASVRFGRREERRVRAERRSRRSAAPRATRRSSATWTAFTATCCCTTWGRRLRDAAIYYGTEAPAPGALNLASARAEPAEADEWRTPPLWGLRDIAPYLHDGRAATVEKAIELHSGTAGESASRFKKLDDDSKRQLLAFLNSLSAPKATEGRHVASPPAGRGAGRPARG